MPPITAAFGDYKSLDTSSYVLDIAANSVLSSLAVSEDRPLAFTAV